MKNSKRKKSYRELKADPVIKAPALAWILDRKLFYISLGMVGCLAAGAFVYQGWKSYEEIIAPPAENSPYLAIEPQNSQGVSWASTLMASNHGLEGWDLRETSQPSHGFIQDISGGSVGEVPITLLSSKVASAGSVKALAQVYGAGQARRQYDHYVAKLSERGEVQSGQVSDSGIYGAKFAQGFLIVSGDAIVGAQTPDDATRDRLFDEYLGSIEATLQESGCVDISAADGSRRSIYFDPSGFEGLQGSQTVEPQVNTDYLPTLQAIGAGEISDPYAKIPEGPLPASLPALPAEVAKPTIASAPATVESFAAEAIYRVQDPLGPGCGWDWSAQKPLQYDAQALKIAEEDTITRVQNEVNGSAQGYVDSKISWARVAALLLPQLDSWNGYVNGVNGVHGLWGKLVSDRNALKPSWDSYVADHDSWFSFDGRKAEAQRNYQASLDRCLADRKAHDDWEAEWGPDAVKAREQALREQQQNQPKPNATPAPTPTASPSQTPVAPPEPQDCSRDPQRPAILDQNKPAEPQPPVIPEDVTVPDSWTKPRS